jgi:hypothetical protein
VAGPDVQSRDRRRPVGERLLIQVLGITGETARYDCAEAVPTRTHIAAIALMFRVEPAGTHTFSPLATNFNEPDRHNTREVFGSVDAAFTLVSRDFRIRAQRTSSIGLAVHDPSTDDSIGSCLFSTQLMIGVSQSTLSDHAPTAAVKHAE